MQREYSRCEASLRANASGGVTGLYGSQACSPLLNTFSSRVCLSTPRMWTPPFASTDGSGMGTPCCRRHCAYLMPCARKLRLGVALGVAPAPAVATAAPPGDREQATAATSSTDARQPTRTLLLICVS